MKKISLILLAVLSAGLLSACSYESSDTTERDRVEQQQNVYVDSQPVPFFDWSLERHLMTRLYEARNDAVTTYSYARNLAGDVVFGCKSIGFPLSADSQLTNPEKVSRSSQGGYAILPQAEPNGLFSGAVNRGTYIFCLNEDGTVTPSYFESDVEVHMAELDGSGRSLQGVRTLKIETSQK